MQALVTKKVPLTLMSCIRSNRLGSVCSVGVNEMADALFTNYINSAKFLYCFINYILYLVFKPNITLNSQCFTTCFFHFFCCRKNSSSQFCIFFN